MAVGGIAILLMIFHNLNTAGPGRVIGPLETNAPLRVDANAVLAFPVASQRLEPVPRQCRKVPKCCSRFQTVQLQACRALNPGECLDVFALSEISGALVPIADDHPAKSSLPYALRQT